MPPKKKPSVTPLTSIRSTRSNRTVAPIYPMSGEKKSAKRGRGRGRPRKEISALIESTDDSQSLGSDEIPDSGEETKELETKDKSDDETSKTVINYHKKFGRFQCYVDCTPVRIEDAIISKSESDDSQEEMVLNMESVENIESVIGVMAGNAIIHTLKVDDDNTDSSQEENTEQPLKENEKVTVADEQEVKQNKETSSANDKNSEDDKSLEATEVDMSDETEKSTFTQAQEITSHFSALSVDQKNDQSSQDNLMDVTYEDNVNEIMLEETSQKSQDQVFHIDPLDSEFAVECISEEVVCEEENPTNEEKSSPEEETIYETHIHIDDENTNTSLPASSLQIMNEESNTFSSLDKKENSEEPITDSVEAVTSESEKDFNADKNNSNEPPVTEHISKERESTDHDVAHTDKTTSENKKTPLIKRRSELKTFNKAGRPRKSESKSPKPKTNKKILEKQNSDASESSTNSENSIRRSSRIKSISVLKQKSKGHGVVKSNGEGSKKSNVDIEMSESSSNGNDVEKIPVPMDSPSFATPSSGYDSDQKPVKVKSRWRRSSELEMGNSPNVSKCSSPLSSTSESSGQLVALSNQDCAILSKKEKAALDAEVERRLKQFVHLKENVYLTERVSCKEAKKMTCDCFLTQEEIDLGEFGCGEDCLNRLLMIECGNLCAVGDRCTNKRFQKNQFAPSEVFNTHKKGLGIRASANIPFGEFILEYVGEVLDPDEFENRATEYSKDKNQHYYFMSLRSDAVIDATLKGNISRFINHSCEPNAETQKWTVNGELRIGFFSKRMILAGEEITFDYQFQRYGKEAQKCFCEAPSCRGWLGEEPDDDDEDEDDEDEEEDDEEEDEEEEEEVEIETVIEKKDELETFEEHAEQTIEKDISELQTEETVEGSTEPLEKPTKPKPKKKEKKKLVKLKKSRKDIFDDLDLDEEIATLQTTGVKNQAHTLKLSRLMVRAKETTQRSKLLSLLRHGELPCRRLFLDYHGLRLVHGWMMDAQQMVKVDPTIENLRLEILQTLATLPIPNKTMLQDSKVLPTVEKWSKQEEGEESPLDCDSNSPKLELEPNQTEEIEQKEPSNFSLQLDKLNEEIEHVKVVEDKKEEVLEDKVKAEEIILTDVIKKEGENGDKPQEGMSQIFNEDMDISPSPSFDDKESIIEEGKEEVKNVIDKPSLKMEFISLALKLLSEWSSLKEVFKIPKKERIEQMKEHEREANRIYKAGLGLEQDNTYDNKAESRYRALQRQNRPDRKEELSKKPVKLDDYRTITSVPKLTKYQRRQLFALKVEQEEEEKRRQRDLWRQHEQRCLSMGTDPRFTAPFDPNRGYHCIWNPQTGQWQPVLPPSQGLIQTPSGLISTNQGINQNIPPPNLQHLVASLQNMTPSNQYMPSSTPYNPTTSYNTSNQQYNTANAGYNTANIPYNTPNTPYNQAPLPAIMNSPQMSMMNKHIPPSPNITIQTRPNFSPMGNIQNIPLPQSNVPPSIPLPNPNIPPPNLQLPQSQQIPVLGSNITTANYPTYSNNSGVTHLPNMSALPNAIHPYQNKQTSNSMQPTHAILNNPPLPSCPPPALAQQNGKMTHEDQIPAKFMGPIPPPVKLPPKWKCVKDKYGRPYYYHIKVRKPQWEPPDLTGEAAASETESSSDTSSLSSDSEVTDDSDDEIDDNKLLRQIKSKFQKMDEEKNGKRTRAESEDVQGEIDSDKAALIDLLSGEVGPDNEYAIKDTVVTPVKKRRVGLVTEIIISPRTEEDMLESKQNLKRYKENKEQIKKEKEMMHIVEKQRKAAEAAAYANKQKHKSRQEKHKSHAKSKVKEVPEISGEAAKKIKEKFRSSMATVMVSILNPYRKSDCTQARITSTEDFKHLARKLTYFVMLKELKHISNIEELTCTDSVKAKAKEFVRKYMSKFGGEYQRDELDNDN